MSVELESLRMQASVRLEELCMHLFPQGRKSGARWVCGSIQGEPGDSFSVNLRTGVFGDFAVDADMQVGAVNLWMAARDCDFRSACRDLSAWLGAVNPIPEHREFVAKKKKVEPCLFPELRFPTEAEMRELAARRSVRPAAVYLAIKRRVLWMFDHPVNGVCWLWTDQRRKCGIRRRLDGEPFQLSDHATKSAACPCSIMNEPLGYIEAASQQCFAVVEGAPDGLAVYDQAIAIGKRMSVAPVVMPCTAARFTVESLKALEGKRGRIFVDNDEAGRRASMEWMRQLGTAGIKVDAFSFEGFENVKDLNDYCKLHLPDTTQHPMAFALEPPDAPM